MTWSFDETTAPISAKDQVRILVQDVDSADPLVSDETIALYLTGGDLEQDDVYLSAAAVAGVISLKFARMAESIGAGNDKVQWGDRAAKYATLQTTLTTRSPIGSASVVPYAGGIAVTDVAARQANTNRVRGRFERDVWPDTRYGYRR